MPGGNPLKTLNQFGGGKKGTMLQAGESLANAGVTSFIVLEDAVIGTMTAEDTGECLFGYDNSLIFIAGLLIQLPRPASTFAVTSGAVIAYEA